MGRVSDCIKFDLLTAGWVFVVIGIGRDGLTDTRISIDVNWTLPLPKVCSCNLQYLVIREIARVSPTGYDP